MRAVVQQKPKHLGSKLELIRKVISVCTIINNPPLITKTELLSKMIVVEQEDLQQKLDEKNNRDVKYLSTVNIIEANKVDYYISAAILDGTIGITSDSFTDVQVKVFEAVRKINFNKLRSAAINQNNNLEKLSMLPRFPGYWAYMHELLKILNNQNSFSMPVPDIGNVLKQLKKYKKLGIRKGDSDKGNGCFILVPKINSFLKMPALPNNPDSQDQGQVIKVINPVTGVIEEL